MPQEMLGWVDSGGRLDYGRLLVVALHGLLPHLGDLHIFLTRSQHWQKELLE